MDSYLIKILISLGHPIPKKWQLSPHKHLPIQYGSGPQYEKDDPSPLLNKHGILRIQRIVGGILYYGRAVNNKLLVELSEIGSQQASATENTEKAVCQLLHYCATFPNDGITY